MPRTDRPYVTKRSGPLAKLRVRAKLTTEAAAAALEISAGGLGNIERGARASDELLAKMAEVYSCSMLTVRRSYLEGRREFIVRETP